MNEEIERCIAEFLDSGLPHQLPSKGLYTGSEQTREKLQEHSVCVCNVYLCVYVWDVMCVSGVCAMCGAYGCV